MLKISPNDFDIGFSGSDLSTVLPSLFPEAGELPGFHVGKSRIPGRLRIPGPFVNAFRELLESNYNLFGRGQSETVLLIPQVLNDLVSIVVGNTATRIEMPPTRRGPVPLIDHAPPYGIHTRPVAGFSTQDPYVTSALGPILEFTPYDAFQKQHENLRFAGVAKLFLDWLPQPTVLRLITRGDLEWEAGQRSEGDRQSVMRRSEGAFHLGECCRMVVPRVIRQHIDRTDDSSTCRLMLGPLRSFILLSENTWQHCYRDVIQDMIGERRMIRGSFETLLINAKKAHLSGKEGRICIPRILQDHCLIDHGDTVRYKVFGSLAIFASDVYAKTQLFKDWIAYLYQRRERGWYNESTEYPESI